MDDAVRDLDCRRLGWGVTSQIDVGWLAFDKRTRKACYCHSMAISSLHRTWQLDRNSDLGLSGSQLPSVLNM